MLHSSNVKITKMRRKQCRLPLKADSARYKAGQRREWDTTAPGWKDWWHYAEPALQPVSERMIDLANIRPGQQVLAAGRR